MANVFMCLPKVAILLAVYNGERYIEEQIKSIFSQEGVDVSVYVSIDGIDDKCESIIKRLSLVHSIFVLPSVGRIGSAGKNFFRLINDVDFSDYDYISFSDQDDIWKPKKLERAISKIESSDFDAYSSNVIAFWESGKKSLVKKSYSQKKYDYLFESPGPGCTYVFTAKFISHFKSYIGIRKNELHNVWLHDWCCYSFARYNSYRWYIDDWPSMYYRQHSDNSVGANYGFKSLLNRALVVLSLEGFERVYHQSLFLGQTHLEPISYIVGGGRRNLLRLALLSFQCRRQSIHGIFFFTVCLLHSIRGTRVL